MVSHELRISGYVQGVGFRGYIKQTAFANGIKGEAWNTDAGIVRVIAQHEEEGTLKRFEEEMWNGPGRVDDVKVEEGPSRVYADFQVTETR